MVVDNSVGKIRILHIPDASKQNLYIKSWKKATTINFSKYNIKETDLRVKTATFTSPDYIDLTTGLYAVLISSKYHENFAGIVLDVDYDPSTGLYNYQCQDWSRAFMLKIATGRWPGITTIYDVILNYVTRNQLQVIHDNNYEKKKKKNKNAKKSNTYSASEKAKFQNTLSGIRPLWKYDQSIYNGNTYKGNPFKKKPKLILKGKTYIEVIRNLVFGQLGYYDVWFNDRGILQVEPLSKKDWEGTGLHVTTPQMASQKYKFSTTNAITQVAVEASGLDAGKLFTSTDLGTKLDLSMFFGWQGASITDPTKQDKNTSNATKTTTTTNNANYKNNKIWIGADGGSGDFCQEIISELKKNGWSCHYSGEGANVHYTDLDKDVTGDYAVIAIVDNGFCCTTIKEAYVNFCKKGTPYLKRNGVRVMFMFDTRSWLSNSSRGMGPFRYGKFNYHVFHTAWDDPSGYCTSMNSTQFFKDWGATYCAHPTAKGIVKQFLNGGICE